MDVHQICYTVALAGICFGFFGNMLSLAAFRRIKKADPKAEGQRTQMLIIVSDIVSSVLSFYSGGYLMLTLDYWRQPQPSDAGTPRFIVYVVYFLPYPMKHVLGTSMLVLLNGTCYDRIQAMRHPLAYWQVDQRKRLRNTAVIALLVGITCSLYHFGRMIPTTETEYQNSILMAANGSVRASASSTNGTLVSKTPPVPNPFSNASNNNTEDSNKSDQRSEIGGYVIRENQAFLRHPIVQMDAALEGLVRITALIALSIQMIRLTRLYAAFCRNQESSNSTSVSRRNPRRDRVQNDNFVSGAQAFECTGNNNNNNKNEPQTITIEKSSVVQVSKVANNPSRSASSKLPRTNEDKSISSLNENRLTGLLIAQISLVVMAYIPVVLYFSLLASGASLPDLLDGLELLMVLSTSAQISYNWLVYFIMSKSFRSVSLEILRDLRKPIVHAFYTPSNNHPVDNDTVIELK